MRFLIQEFRSEKKPGRARWYLRLERDGVFQGWAIPKGVPDRPGVRHLAIPVGNYRLDQVKFEGEVTSSRFGPGKISILDQGEYTPTKWTKDQICIRLTGKKARGLYNLQLVEFQTTGEEGWLLEKKPEGTAPHPATPGRAKKPAKSNSRAVGRVQRQSPPPRRPRRTKSSKTGRRPAAGENSPGRKGQEGNYILDGRHIVRTSSSLPPKEEQRTQRRSPPPARRRKKKNTVGRLKKTKRKSSRRSSGFTTSSSIARRLLGLWR